MPMRLKECPKTAIPPLVAGNAPGLPGCAATGTQIWVSWPGTLDEDRADRRRVRLHRLAIRGRLERGGVEDVDLAGAHVGREDIRGRGLDLREVGEAAGRERDAGADLRSRRVEARDVVRAASEDRGSVIGDDELVDAAELGRQLAPAGGGARGPFWVR